MEHQIVILAKMILRDRCRTSYDLAYFFAVGAILERHGMEIKQRKTDRQIDR